MGEITTVGLDIGERVLRVHGAGAEGRRALQRRLRRGEVRAFFAGLPRCLVGMEACATAHHRAGELRALGHDVRLIPPAYVEPCVVRQKNDAADAAAIREAVARPSVRATPVRTADQQAARVVQRTHELLPRRRVALVGAIRGRMAESGVLAPAGPQHVGRPIERIVDPQVQLPAAARGALDAPADQLVEPDRRIGRLEADVRRRRREDADGARPPAVPGGDRPHRRGRDRGGRARHPGLPARARLRRVARPRAAAELERREGPARADRQDGRPRWATARSAARS